jgi:tungstate transport system substrate-binding protein
VIERRLAALVCSVLFLAVTASAETITMATTTSTQNSGLLDILLPALAEDTGIQVKVIAKGTGAALRDARDGNVDLVFVHDPVREEKLVADGFGLYRLAVMHNDFVIVGPGSDPAGVGGLRDAARALKRIAAGPYDFVSRGDDSGTHGKEKALWNKAGLVPSGRWYHSIGQGMGKTLVYAEEKGAYTLTDRGTFLKYKYGRTGGLDLDVLVEGDERLFNPYGVIPVNPAKHPHVRRDAAERAARWFVSPRAQTLIANYRIHGRPAFFPDVVRKPQ